MAVRAAAGVGPVVLGSPVGAGRRLDPGNLAVPILGLALLGRDLVELAARERRRSRLVRAFALAVAACGALVVALQARSLADGGVTALTAAAAVALLVAAADQLTLEVPIGDEIQQFGVTEAVWAAALVLA